MKKFLKNFQNSISIGYRKFPALGELSLNRCSGWQRGISVQLHVFAIASEIGFCDVAYLKFDEGDKVKVSSVVEKTRVAPIKTTTIPKVEFQATLQRHG